LASQREASVVVPAGLAAVAGRRRLTSTPRAADGPAPPGSGSAGRTRRRRSRQLLPPVPRSTQLHAAVTRWPASGAGVEAERHGGQDRAAAHRSLDKVAAHMRDSLPTPRLLRPVLPRVPPCRATCTYSCSRPPSQSRRIGRMAVPGGGEGSNDVVAQTMFAVMHGSGNRQSGRRTPGGGALCRWIHIVEPPRAPFLCWPWRSVLPSPAAGPPARVPARRRRRQRRCPPRRLPLRRAPRRFPCLAVLPRSRRLQARRPQ
jgi:hypothetical protein